MNSKLKNNLKRSLAAATVVVAAAGAFAAPAMAAPSGGYGTKLGSLYLTIPSGIAVDMFLMNTDAPCPVTSTNVQAYISHVDTDPVPTDPKNTWSDIVLYSNSTNGFDSAAPMSVPIGDTVAARATSTGRNMQSGVYNIRVRCQNNFGNVIGGFFEQDVTFTNPLAPAVNQAATYTSPVVVQDTSTVTASSSLSTFVQGQPTTLSATVAQPAGGTHGVPQGQVEFFDGATSLGAATSLVAGVASLTNNTLAVGTHNITAAYAGAFYYSAVTSAATSVVVTAPVAPLTTTAIGVSINGTTVPNPGSHSETTTALKGSTNDNITLSAMVTADTGTATPVGTCEYYDGGSSLGAPAAAVNGVCPEKVLSQGPAKTYDFTVSFTPTGNFVPSSSLSFFLTLEASTIVPAVETINVTVAAGALTIKLKDPLLSQVTMSTPVLNSDATMLTSTGAMQTVTVADLRAGNPGWTAKGQVTNFDGKGVGVGSNAGEIIRGNNLGWTPKVLAKNPNQVIIAGTPVLSPVLPIDAGAAASSAGIFAPAVLASAAANAGTGTADLGADLTLNVPTNTVAGLYSAFLTLTVA